MQFSCNSNEKPAKNKDNNEKIKQEISLEEGIVKYQIKLEIPTKKNAGLFEKVVSGVVESLVENFDPGISLRFKKDKAKLFLDDIDEFENSINVDNAININNMIEGIKYYNFKSKEETVLESNDVEKIARVKTMKNDKYYLSQLDDTASILGYLCYHALMIDKYDNDTISIWYTLLIDIPLSPFEYSGLDGLALEMSISAFSVCASEIIFANQADSLFEIPQGYIEKRE